MGDEPGAGEDRSPAAGRKGEEEYGAVTDEALMSRPRSEADVGEEGGGVSKAVEGLMFERVAILELLRSRGWRGFAFWLAFSDDSREKKASGD